ncbi:DNA polymerase/3'-5' exonuclease PolX [Pedobacter arcticus]|uniref:DNA polymerase/3'-5' exonuclease PolX n=1 Tax=Pedobacter arcticus TaxID=752140 RepID=UPI000318C84B|nr:DNA polymerase/3'-5' exonuclease PolX [Pedobacter arcticus]
MENKEISKKFKLLGQLMELNGENPFKIKSINNASFKIDKLPFKLKDKAVNELENIEGIGKSTASKIVELLTAGNIAELDALIDNTPEGILEMMTIKGLGPKKVKVVWEELGIENVGELYYACNENRLIEAKGFGLKTQEDIKKAIEFKMANAGRFLYAKIEKTAEAYRLQFEKTLTKTDKNAKVLISGELRRKCEIIESLSYLMVSTESISVITSLFDTEVFEVSCVGNQVNLKDQTGLNIAVELCTPSDEIFKLFETTGCEEHVIRVKALLQGETDFTSEEELYQTAGMQFIAPELRENSNEVEKALRNQIPDLIEYSDLRGVLHNHSTWSDGIHTVKEMALYCRDVLKLEYLGISDHSKSAGYAGGLSIERVLQQHKEIDTLNKELAPFKIFKGIESDILSNGSLDYPEEILKKFDFVVASIHSAMKMDEEKATERLIKAIENPYTTILGHPTGRLLLSRAGYPINYQKIIDACEENNVVIEINANPLRLDLDWRWHQYALEKGVLLAVNPDAHRNEGFMDMQYGIYVGRKGGLSKEKCLNSFSLAEISNFFEQKKSH